MKKIQYHEPNQKEKDNYIVRKKASMLLECVFLLILSVLGGPVIYSNLLQDVNSLPQLKFIFFILVIMMGIASLILIFREIRYLITFQFDDDDLKTLKVRKATRKFWRGIIHNLLYDSRFRKIQLINLLELCRLVWKFIQYVLLNTICIVIVTNIMFPLNLSGKDKITVTNLFDIYEIVIPFVACILIMLAFLFLTISIVYNKKFLKASVKTLAICAALIIFSRANSIERVNLLRDDRFLLGLFIYLLISVVLSLFIKRVTRKTIASIFSTEELKNELEKLDNSVSPEKRGQMLTTESRNIVVNQQWSEYVHLSEVKISSSIKKNDIEIGEDGLIIKDSLFNFHESLLFKVRFSLVKYLFVVKEDEIVIKSIGIDGQIKRIVKENRGDFIYKNQ